jgi:hypothetical protein
MADPTLPTEHNVHYRQILYLNQLYRLKTSAEYLRHYRDSLAKWATWIATLRAIASSGAIAAWAIVQAHPLLWGGIIAAAQVADALKDVMPISKQ